MRACAQCGLSIGDAATFCPVCGARADAPVSTVSAEPGFGAAQSDNGGNGRAVGHDDRASSGREEALSGRLQRAALPMRRPVL